MVKKCLKSRIFWMLISIIIIGTIFLYWEEMYDYYGETVELIFFCLLITSTTLCLINLSRKNGIRRLLTILTCSFAFSLFWNISYREDFADNDLLYSLCALLFFFVCIPSWTLILLKLVWKDKSDDIDKDEDKKLIKKTRRKTNKK